jgi:hypothetical protein
MFSAPQILLSSRFFAARQDFVPRASCPCSGMARMARAQVGLRSAALDALWRRFSFGFRLQMEFWARAREVARRYSPTVVCRAQGALHVASARVLAADDFYTLDRDQARLARSAGLPALGVYAPTRSEGFQLSVLSYRRRDIDLPQGRAVYPQVHRLLITADAGGSDLYFRIQCARERRSCGGNCHHPDRPPGVRWAARWCRRTRQTPFACPAFPERRPKPCWGVRNSDG